MRKLHIRQNDMLLATELFIVVFCPSHLPQSPIVSENVGRKINRV